MGGAVAGEVASAMATDLIFRYLTTTWTEDDEVSADHFALRMKEAVEIANQEIFRYAGEHPELKGMGTTVTAAGVFGDHLYLTQIGDSRGYLVRGGQAIQLTKDQSLTQRLVDAGELTEEEAEQSERRNIILQALGPDAQVKVDLTHQTLRRGDMLILCSDGLSGLVRREEFALLTTAYLDLSDLCSALIDLANQRGGPDNITVVAVRFDGEGLRQPSESEGAGYQVYQPRNDEEAASEEPSTPQSTVEPPSAPTVRLPTALLVFLALLGLLVALLPLWR